MNNLPSALDNHNATTYRTGHFTKEQQQYLEETASKQNKIIGNWFKQNPKRMIGPGQLHKLLNLAWPVTSTRRAINNLTEDGILRKTDEITDGIYGKPEHQWAWQWPQRTQPTKQTSLFDQGGQPSWM